MRHKIKLNNKSNLAKIIIKYLANVKCKTIHNCFLNSLLLGVKGLNREPMYFD